MPLLFKLTLTSTVPASPVQTSSSVDLWRTELSASNPGTVSSQSSEELSAHEDLLSYIIISAAAWPP